MYECQLRCEEFHHSTFMWKIKAYRRAAAQLYSAQMEENQDLLRGLVSTISYSNDTDGTERYQCNVCCAVFNYDFDILFHMRVHDIDENRSRDKCIRSNDSRTQSSMKTLPAKPYECLLCANTFVSSESLLSHVMTFHPSEQNSPVAKVPKGLLPYNWPKVPPSYCLQQSNLPDNANILSPPPPPPQEVQNKAVIHPDNNPKRTDVSMPLANSDHERVSEQQTQLTAPFNQTSNGFALFREKLPPPPPPSPPPPPPVQKIGPMPRPTSWKENLLPNRKPHAQLLPQPCPQVNPPKPEHVLPQPQRRSQDRTPRIRSPPVPYPLTSPPVLKAATQSTTKGSFRAVNGQYKTEIKECPAIEDRTDPLDLSIRMDKRRLNSDDLQSQKAQDHSLHHVRKSRRVSVKIRKIDLNDYTSGNQEGLKYDLNGFQGNGPVRYGQEAVSVPSKQDVPPIPKQPQNPTKRFDQEDDNQDSIRHVKLKCNNDFDIENPKSKGGKLSGKCMKHIPETDAPLSLCNEVTGQISRGDRPLRTSLDSATDSKEGSPIDVKCGATGRDNFLPSSLSPLLKFRSLNQQHQLDQNHQQKQQELLILDENGEYTPCDSPFHNEFFRNTTNISQQKEKLSSNLVSLIDQQELQAHFQIELDFAELKLKRKYEAFGLRSDLMHRKRCPRTLSVQDFDPKRPETEQVRPISDQAKSNKDMDELTTSPLAKDNDENVLKSIGRYRSDVHSEDDSFTPKILRSYSIQSLPSYDIVQSPQ